MLTNAAIKSARPKDRAYKIFDSRGLHLFVAPTGLKAWRMKYRYGGKEKLLSIGQWPDMQLDEARERADRAHDQLAQGIDPSTHNRVQICIFEDVARQWHALQRSRWTDRHGKDVLDSLERDVFPELGAMPIGAIDAPTVLKALRAIEARGSLETARRVRQRISGVFGFAIAEGMVDSDPAAPVSRALKPQAIRRHQPALLQLDEVRALLAACERAGGPPIVRLASRFLALTAVRMGALLGASWDQFEQLDTSAPVWRVPAEHMKLAKAKKADPAFAHVVPLSAPAIDILQQLKKFGYDTRSSQLFPISPAAIGALYKRAGFERRHVPHGWRASFSTILNERLPGERDTIDRALAHVPKDKVEAAYNRAEQLDRRRAIYDAWGKLLSPELCP